MQLNDNPLFARDDCIKCPTQAPQCTCGVNQQCVSVLQSCSACTSFKCVDNGSSGSSGGGGGGISGGAVAGAVIGALILLGLAVGGLLWYRRRSKASNASANEPKVTPDVPAPATSVLNREDPYEKDARSSSTPSSSVIEAYRIYNAMMNANAHQNQLQAAQAAPGPSLDRRQSANGTIESDPFKDAQSIQTTSASTQSTNVIPIALVPHGSLHSTSESHTADNSQTAGMPSRPARAPDLNIDPLSAGLNLEHINVSNDSFRPPNGPYSHSQLSHVSARESVLSNGTYASDLLTEAPQIVTSTSGAVRTFLGVAKAEVIMAPGSHPSTPMSYDSGVTGSSRVVRPTLRSPLGQTSFGPGDALRDSAGVQEIEYPIHNPFSDENSMAGKSPTGSTSTFGLPTPVPLPSTASPTQHSYLMNMNSPNTSQSSPLTRPLSTATAAGSVIGADIGSATLVRLGSNASHNSARSMNRFTSAKLVSPMITGTPSSETSGMMQAQQAQALAAARARAEASGLPVANSSPAAPSLMRRMSEAGSVASNGGFSILESFTFVPPSPISNRPPRSPSSPNLFSPEPPSAGGVDGLPANPPSPSTRQMQGMSTASAVSNSSALEGYDFRIDPGSAPPTPSLPSGGQAQQQNAPATLQKGQTNPPSAGAKRSQRQRASLDTLALTADLSAFPLSFDEGLRDSFANLTKH